MMDIFKEMKATKKNKKQFNYMLGKTTHLIIYDFAHPIKKKKYNETIYYYFNAKVISKNGELIMPGNHTIQMPAKCAVFPLFCLLEDKKMVSLKEICVTIDKLSNRNYQFTIHTK